MYGIIQSTKLAEILADGFVRIANGSTYPLLVYWYSGIVNYFVPSGGSKWAIEAPYILAAGKSLGVPAAKVVTAYAWGDMMTDIIQPFWAIPLLAAAKLDFREILGFCMVLFCVYAPIVSLAFLLFPR
jgi:short-chain fatty acids transporter